MRGGESKTGKDEKPIQDCLMEWLVTAVGMCVSNSTGPSV